MMTVANRSGDREWDITNLATNHQFVGVNKYFTTDRPERIRKEGRGNQVPCV